jgi:DNA-binding MarR family transcriptional regulator
LNMAKKNTGAASPRSISNEYVMRILLALRRIIRAVDIYSRKLATEHNITGPQLICLYSIVNEGPLTQSALSKRYSLSASTVTGILDRLEIKGLVIRERSKSDRRKIKVNATDKGLELVKKAPSLLQDKLAEAIRKQTELEQAAITLSLERIVELMEVGHLEAAPMLAEGSKLDQPKEELC